MTRTKRGYRVGDLERGSGGQCDRGQRLWRDLEKERERERDRDKNRSSERETEREKEIGWHCRSVRSL